MNYIDTITDTIDENGVKIRTIIRTIKPNTYTAQQKAALERYRQTHRAQISAYNTELQKEKYNSDPEYRQKIRTKQRERAERLRKERYETDPEYRKKIDRRANKSRSYSLKL